MGAAGDAGPARVGDTGEITRRLPAGTVSLLFTDIEGSTRLLDALGDDYGTLLADHHRLLRATWVEHGGVEVDTEGDAFFVAFADAAAAVAAAVDAQRRLAEHDWPGGERVRVRMGVHTGTPRIQNGTYWGADVHYAARLASAAHGGQVLVSASTRALIGAKPVEPLGEHALKDFTAPREIFHVVIDGARADAFPPPRTLGRPRGNVPVPATNLLGRDDELADLVERCTDGQRLLSIVGPGGSGKTRLAIELGHSVAEHFESVWFIALDAVREPADVMPAVARTIGLPEVAGVDDADRVVDHVRPRRTLLLLDNAEHVLDAAPEIGRLALAGDGVRVVVTSQATLRVAGEHVMRLAALDVPEAVELLVERARAAGSAFELTPDNAEDVAQLCRRLEGMPLAIELAAARLELLGPAGLTRRLETGLDALGRGARDLPARQRGLRAVLEWTCGLLADDERALLADLSVFADGFTPELADATFGDAIDGLATLLDVGLVRHGEGGRLLLRPPVRRFATELFGSPEDEAAAHGAAADALAEIAEPYEPRWLLMAGEGRLELNPEAENIVAALDWTRDHDPGRHARLAAATAWWMTHSGRARFSRTHIERALSRTDDPRMRARLLQALGNLGLATADPTAALDAAAAWHELGDVEREAASLLYAANLQGHRGDGAAAMAIVEEAAALLEGVADEGLEWMLELGRADALFLTGRHAEGEAILRPRLAGAPDGTWRHFWAATKTADLVLDAGRFAEALELYGQAMRDLGPFRSIQGLLIQADTIAHALIGLGRAKEAATALGVCDLAHAELSWPPRAMLATALDRVRAGLDDEQQAAGRRRAAELGVERGLAWIGAVARGEMPDGM